MRLVLASTSPRRVELLGLLKVPFEVRSPTCEEVIRPGRSADGLVADFAKAKAESVAAYAGDALVLASDTLIECDGTSLGKPSDAAEARVMLRQLAGRVHAVKTAVSVVCRNRNLDKTEVATARVWMKSYEPDAHERYLSTNDSLGKAGAYSIQGPGADLIARLEGDFTIVVGFPLRLVARLLAEGGIPLPVDVEAIYGTKPYANWSRFSG